MIQVTQEELWAFNGLNGLAQNTRVELDRQIAARDALIKLLEQKYDAVFDVKTGTFNPKEKSVKLREDSGG